jgi:hypothetical protein
MRGEKKYHREQKTESGMRWFAVYDFRWHTSILLGECRVIATTEVSPAQHDVAENLAKLSRSVRQTRDLARRGWSFIGARFQCGLIHSACTASPLKIFNPRLSKLAANPSNSYSLGLDMPAIHSWNSWPDR